MPCQSLPEPVRELRACKTRCEGARRVRCLLPACVYLHCRNQRQASSFACAAVKSVGIQRTGTCMTPVQFWPSRPTILQQAIHRIAMGQCMQAGPCACLVAHFHWVHPPPACRAQLASFYTSCACLPCALANFGCEILIGRSISPAESIFSSSCLRSLIGRNEGQCHSQTIQPKLKILKSICIAVVNCTGYQWRQISRSCRHLRIAFCIAFFVRILQQG